MTTLVLARSVPRIKGFRLLLIACAALASPALGCRVQASGSTSLPNPMRGAPLRPASVQIDDHTGDEEILGLEPGRLQRRAMLVRLDEEAICADLWLPFWRGASPQELDARGPERLGRLALRLRSGGAERQPSGPPERWTVLEEADRRVAEGRVCFPNDGLVAAAPTALMLDAGVGAAHWVFVFRLF